MKSSFPYLVAVGLLAFGHAKAAAFEISYQSTREDPDPTTQGWTGDEVTAPMADSTGDGLVDGNANVGEVSGPLWQVYDRRTELNLNLPGYRHALKSPDLDAAYANGWTFEFTALARQTDASSGFVGWGFDQASDPGWRTTRAATRIGFVVGIGAGNAFTVATHGGDSLVLGPDSALVAHTIRAEALPMSPLFEWFVNGVSQGFVDIRTGQSAGGLTLNRVYFGGRGSTPLGEATSWGGVSLRSGAETSMETEVVAREIQAHSDSIFGNGVDTATGSFMRGLTLLSVNGVRELSFPIYHDSRLTARRGPLGYGWSHPYEARLEGELRDDVVIHWDANRSSCFAYDDIERTYRGLDEDVRYAILTDGVSNDTTYWTVTLLDGTSYQFFPDGQLRAVSNKVHQSLTMRYDSKGRLERITEGPSQFLDLTYNDQGLLATLEDRLGRQVALTYDSNQHLIRTTAPVLFGPTVRGDPIESVAIPDNDSNGISFPIEVSDEGTAGWAKVSGLRIHHNRLDDLTVLIRSPAGTVVDVVLVQTGEVSYDSKIDMSSFDGEGRSGVWTLKIVDSRSGGTGIVTDYGLQLTGASRSIGFAYDADARITGGVDMLGDPIFSCVYDSLGRVIAQDDGRPETPASSVVYTELTGGNQETRWTAPDGHTWIMVHDSSFHLLSATDPLGNRATFTYDANGNRISRTDPRGNTTRFTYDAFGNVGSVTDPANHTTHFTSTSVGNNVASITDALGRKTTFAYSNSRLTRVTDALNFWDRKTYHSSGQVASVVLFDQASVAFVEDSNGNLVASNNTWNTSNSRAEYDAAGRTIKTWNADNHLTEIRYNAAGDVIEEIDPNGNSIKSEYDHRGRLVRKIDRRGFASTFSYDLNNNLLSSTNALGETTTYTYDAANRPVQVSNPLGNTTSFEIDAAGRRIATTDALGRTTRKDYDANGNLIAIYDANGICAMKITYDERDLPIRTEDAFGHVTSATYDAVGRKVSTTDARGQTTVFDYDKLGRPTRVTDALGRVAETNYKSDDVVASIKGPGAKPVKFTYDLGNNLTVLTRTASGSQNRYTYDTADRVSKINFADGRSLDLDYDSMGRLVYSKKGSGSTQDDRDRRYVYDASGNLTKVRDNKGGGDFRDRLIRTFDALGRMTSYTDEGGNQIQYTYDAAGNLATLVYPDGWTVSYAYDAVKRLTSVTDGDGRITRYTWDVRNLLTKIDLPNGTVRNLRYDRQGQIINREDLDASGSVIIAYSYSYDSMGSLESEEVDPEPGPLTVQSHTLTFNEQYEIRRMDGHDVNYDGSGNMRNAPPGYGFDNLVYTARGKLFQTDGYEYDYDEEDRLVGWKSRSDPRNDAATLVINPVGRLSQILSKSVPNTEPTRYVYGIGLIYEETDGELLVYHYDQRGSTVALSNTVGLTSGRVTYDPYGKVTQRVGFTDTLFLFNGLFGVVTSPDDLLQMRFRWYWPEIGRFITADAHLGDIGLPSSINPFAYAQGDPVMRVDPEGEFPWILAGAAIGAAANTAAILAVDLLEDGQINRSPEEYIAAAVGGAVGGALGAASFGLGTGAVAFVAAVGTGAAATASENLTLQILSGEGIDGGELAGATAFGAATGALGFGASRVFGKVSPKIFKAYGSKSAVVRFLFGPATGSEARQRATEIAISGGLRFGGRFTKLGGFPLLASRVSDLFGSGPDSGGNQSEIGLGSAPIYLGALGETNRGRVRRFGEYIHYDLYLNTLRLADRPVPSHSSNTLSGF